MPFFLAGPARRRVLDRGFDQPDGAMAFAFAEVGAQTDDDLGGPGVGEEIGQSRLRRTPRAREVEDDRGDEVFVGDARDAGDSVFGRHRQQVFAEAVGGDVFGQPPQLVVDLDDGLVEERRRAGEELDRAHLGQFGAGTWDRLSPLRHLAREAALEPQQPEEVVAEDELRQFALDEDDDRFFAEVLANLLRRLGGGEEGSARVRSASVGSRWRRPQQRQ